MSEYLFYIPTRIARLIVEDYEICGKAKAVSTLRKTVAETPIGFSLDVYCSIVESLRCTDLDTGQFIVSVNLLDLVK